MQLQYNVYNETDFEPIWNDYAFTHPVWAGDFGKYNLSESSTMREQAVPFISGLQHSTDPENGLTVRLLYEFPHALTRDAGAPAAMWLELQSPPDSDALLVTAAWQNKTATRLPEASWLRFSTGCGAVDPSSWMLHKIGSAVSPDDLLFNGSHSIHGVSEEGVTVSSPNGEEMMRIRPHDAFLMALGDPKPFPNPSKGPDMHLGVSSCLHNNVWGTNYAMWFPYGVGTGEKDVDTGADMVFRFTLEVTSNQSPAPT